MSDHKPDLIDGPIVIPDSTDSLWSRLTEIDGWNSKWLEYIDGYMRQIREEMENAYLRDNRQGAVKAGMLRGFRVAVEVIPSMILREIHEQRSNADSNESPDDEW